MLDHAPRDKAAKLDMVFGDGVVEAEDAVSRLRGLMSTHAEICEACGVGLCFRQSAASSRLRRN